MEDVLYQVAKLAAEANGDGRYVIRDNSDGSKWRGGLSNVGFSASMNHAVMRQNARNAMQDSPLARAIVERNADTVADVGLRPEFAPVISVLGITREEATVRAKEMAELFHLWCMDKKQHRSETLNFYQYQRLYQICQHRDNDIFTRLFYDGDRRLQNPLQFEGIDATMIRGDAFTYTNGIHSGKDGIERDARNREIAFNLWGRTQDGQYQQTTVQARDPKSGRIYMLHGFRPEYQFQGRGFSRLAHAIQEFENITDFSAATIKKAIAQSSIVGFVEPSKDEDASNPLEGILTNGGAGPAAQLFGSDPTAVDGISVDPQRSLTDFYLVPEATLDTPGGMFIANLTRGSSIKFPANTAPADSFDKFVDAFSNYISASTSTPLEVVLMKFGNNFSASRATLLLFWRIVNGWRMEMASDLLDPVVEMFISNEIAVGRLVLPGWSDPRMRAAWLNKSWTGSPVPDIDPGKTAAARKTNLEINATNLDIEARALNGSDAANNIEINRGYFENFATAPWLVTGGQGTVADSTDDGDEDDK